MKKLINTNDRIRIALACGAKILGHLYGSNGSTDWYYRPWSVINVSKQAFRTAVSRQLKTGEIVKVIDPKLGAIYRITPEGCSKFYRDYPLAKLIDQPWDGKWRMVFYDFPCKNNYQRKRFREKLVELGFGSYQKSVYVTPLDVLADLKDYIVNNKLSDFVVVFEGKRIIGEDIKVIAEKLWNLNEINEEYFEIEGKLRGLNSELKQKKGNRTIWESFSKVLSKDPFYHRNFCLLIGQVTE